jgi:hypothetical protein
VHAFYLNKWAEPNFKEISNLTGGKSILLDINSEHSAEEMTRIVTEEVMLTVAKQNG